MATQLSRERLTSTDGSNNIHLWPLATCLSLLYPEDISSPDPDSAHSPQEAVEIISEAEVEAALRRKVARLKQTYADDAGVVLIPIKRGGSRMGDYLAQATNFPLLPIRMNYYDDDNQRLPMPRMVENPNQDALLQILRQHQNSKTINLIFTEAVVESQNTISTAETILRQQINELAEKNGLVCPTLIFTTETLIYKGHTREQLADPLPAGVWAEFVTPLEYWVQGFGCDDMQIGRELNNILARISPYH